MSTSFRLDDRVAVVTGGGGTLGRAMAGALAAAGARVCVLGRRRSTLDVAADQIRAEGGDAMAAVADVLDADTLHAARASVLARWGRIDVLVNAAGGNIQGAVVGPGEDVFGMPMEAFRAVLDLNLVGTVLPTQVFGPPMAEGGEGSVVHISSMAADRAITRVAGYSAAKAGVEQYTRWLAVELARRYGDAVRVNAIAPGFFLADQNRALLIRDDGTPTERARTVVDRTPMARLGDPDDLAGAVVWLASGASRFVTGVVVPVDGGLSAWSGI